MPDRPTISGVFVSTKSTAPLRGTIEIHTATSTMRFELDDEVAHSLCTQLEHFLTQRQNPKTAARGAVRR